MRRAAIPVPRELPSPCDTAVRRRWPGRGQRGERSKAAASVSTGAVALLPPAPLESARSGGAAAAQGWQERCLSESGQQRLSGTGRAAQKEPECSSVIK